MENRSYAILIYNYERKRAKVSDVELDDDSYDDSIDYEILLEELERDNEREDEIEIRSLRNQ